MNRAIPLIILATLLAPLCPRQASPSASADCGLPTITFDYVPPIGSFQNLTGHVDCAAPADYAVAVYIYISGWWTKPTFQSPTTPIQPDGSWATDITTGGSDQLATKIAAFLIPIEYGPPLVAGGAVLPAELYANAAAYTSVNRDEPRTIRFSGYTWEVRNTPLRSGPGNNYFSNDTSNVWVDSSGYLHLAIVQRNGTWYCAEVTNLSTAGYGTHTIEVGSRVDLLDKNVVFGFFTWDDYTPQYNYREIDIEFGRWGDAYAPNAQYVIQPWDVPGNRYRFFLNLSESDSLHQFNWQPDSVQFDSWDRAGTPLQTWAYSNSPAIPPPGGNIHLNLWLLEDQFPSDGQPVEVIIKSYRYTPGPERIYLPVVLQGGG